MFRRTMQPIARTIRSAVGTTALADRVAALEAAAFRPIETPLIAEPIAALVSDPAPVGVPAFQVLDINQLLHDSRGALLRGMPAGADRLLSAGCAGLWYFDWVERTYGHVAEHLGIEYYSPKPEGLPTNVTWIVNTASDMSAVQGDSCDLVFSGQNLEHLWPDEVAGFALEAARVLRPGGSLVIDSPNRTLTKPLNWSHPEHTVELTPAEATELCELAGFDVTATYGIWLCRDARSGEVLPFDPNQVVADWSVTERLLVARDRPEDSFIWWIEAVRSGRAPKPDAVYGLMSRLFQEHWPERVQRLIVPAGHETRSAAEGEWVVSAPGQGGMTMFGPYMPLPAGRHRVTWSLQPSEAAQSAVAACDVVSGPSGHVLARREVHPGERWVSIEFVLDVMTFGLQFRCASTGGAGFAVLRRIELEEGLR